MWVIASTVGRYFAAARIRSKKGIKNDYGPAEKTHPDYPAIMSDSEFVGTHHLANSLSPHPASVVECLASAL